MFILLKKTISFLTGIQRGYIYTLRDAHERDLYIGWTRNPTQRKRQHQKVAQHGTLRYQNLQEHKGQSFQILRTLYWPSRRELERAEAEAIQHFKPLRNKRSYQP